MDHLLRATARAEGRHFWFRGFRRIVTPLIRQAVGQHPGSQILDCGCGTGANVQMLNRFGRASGFDLSPVGLKIGREAGRSRLVRASVTAAPFQTGAFDLVTSFDVLYSLPDRDERAAVAEMFRMTRPGGYAIINVAALKMLSGDHSVLSHEVRRYSRSDLGRLVTGAGFTIVRLTYTNFTLFFPMAAVRLLQRLRGVAAEEDAGQEISVPVAPVNGLLTGLLALESLYLRVFDAPIGSSLLCLARRPEATAESRT